jgi:Ca2+-dependent lipid-binding protein
LKAADANGKSDPYVVIKDTKGLHRPKDRHVVKTKVIDKNLNPVVRKRSMQVCR